MKVTQFEEGYMSDIMKELVDFVGIEFLLEDLYDKFEIEKYNIDSNKIYPDFDHITVI